MKGFYVIPVIIALLILSSCTPSTNNTPEQETSEIEILNHQGYQFTEKIGGDYLAIFGEAQNISGENLEYIKLTAILYDGSGKEIGSDWTYLSTDILRAGEKAPFIFLIRTDEEDYGSYGLTLSEYNKTDREPYRNFEFINVSYYIGDNGYYRVKGEIKNMGDRDVKYVDVILTFYDAEGKVVSAGTYPVGDLSVGSTATFDTSAIPKQITSMVASYSLQTKSSLMQE